MFIDKRTQNHLYVTPGESTSHGTMRMQDLIPAFLSIIRDTPEYVQVMNTIPAHAMENKKADQWNSDDVVELLESLFDALDSHSPEGYYFGAHLGGESDYGLWKMDK